MHNTTESETCVDCGQRFTPIEESFVASMRCPACQAKFRIEKADNMHKTNNFKRYKKPYLPFWQSN